MTVLIWIVLGVFGVVLLVVCGALIEMYRTLEQVRVQSGVLDMRTKLDVGADVETLKAAGLPAELVHAERGLLLILSDRCSTCSLLAARIAGGPPKDMWVLLQPHSAQSAAGWLAEYELDQCSRVIVDVEERIVDPLNIRISPAAVRFVAGEVVAAHTVPSPRRLIEEMSWLRKGGPDEPTYGPVHESFEAVAKQTKMLR